jgi:hypothetical protein
MEPGIKKLIWVTVAVLAIAGVLLVWQIGGVR